MNKGLLMYTVTLWFSSWELEKQMVLNWCPSWSNSNLQSNSPGTTLVGKRKEVESCSDSVSLRVCYFIHRWKQTAASQFLQSSVWLHRFDFTLLGVKIALIKMQRLSRREVNVSGEHVSGCCSTFTFSRSSHGLKDNANVQSVKNAEDYSDGAGIFICSV